MICGFKLHLLYKTFVHLFFGHPGVSPGKSVAKLWCLQAWLITSGYHFVWSNECIQLESAVL